MRYGDSRTALYGVSSIVLPAYLFSAGLGSKLSMWLTPPTMNSQMTRLAFGAKCGRPSGGAKARLRRAAGIVRGQRRRDGAGSASARPVKPMPRSARKRPAGEAAATGVNRSHFFPDVATSSCGRLPVLYTQRGGQWTVIPKPTGKPSVVISLLKCMLSSRSTSGSRREAGLGRSASSASPTTQIPLAVLAPPPG